jgi:hypothetical protein
MVKTQINYPNSKFHFSDVSSNNLVDLDSSDGLILNDDDGLKSKLDINGLMLNNPNVLNHYANVMYDKIEYSSGSSGSKSLILSANNDNNKAHGIKLLNNSNETKYDITGLSSTHVYDISLDALTFKSAGASSGQVVMADEDGAPYWASLPAESQNLSSVLSNGADANGTGITNIPSIAFSNGGSGVTIGTSSNTISLNCSTDANTTRSFDSKYLPVVIGSTTYYLPLFV